MPIGYPGKFLLIGMACLFSARSLTEGFSTRLWLVGPFGYAAFSAFWLAATYAARRPEWLGKRSDGRRSAWATVLLAPYFGFNSLVFGCLCRFSREPAWADVTPHLILGRRLLGREALNRDGAAVLDLAAEFSEHPALRDVAGYRSIPVLDGVAPTSAQLQEALGWLRDATGQGSVYVHCALGHGRSACVVVAYLVDQGLAPDIPTALARLRQVRPGVGLSPDQLRRLDTFFRDPLRR